jgi:thiamine-monophosphate kinase
MSLGEADWLAQLSRDFKIDMPGHVGIGDDAAVIPGPDGKSYVITQDALVEQVHFKRAWFSPEALARKALLVNISDILAMGAVAQYVWMTLALPKNTPSDWAYAFLNGMRSACAEKNILLMGGDTVRASDEGISISLTMIGNAESNQVRLLSQACPGDVLAVTGCLGDAAAGLALFQQGDDSLSADFSSLRRAFIEPVLANHTAERLSKHQAVHAMTDISDGLHVDVSRLLEASKCSVLIDLANVPLSAELRAYAKQTGVQAEELALIGGEDYQLLVACDVDYIETVQQDLIARSLKPLHVLGTLSDSGSGVSYCKQGNDWAIRGEPFAHFVKKDS